MPIGADDVDNSSAEFFGIGRQLQAVFRVQRRQVVKKEPCW